MKIRLLLFLLYMVLPVFLEAAPLSENLSASQLEAQLSSAKPSERVEILAQLVWVYRNNNYEKALQYGLDALDLLESNPRPTLKAQVLHSMAWVHMRGGDYSKAIQLANNAKEIASDSQDGEGLAYALNVLGSVEWYKGNFLGALDYFLKTLEIRKNIGEKLNIARSYNNIGSVYQEIEDYGEARKYHELSLELMEELGNSYGKATSYFNLGIINQRLGDEKKEEYYLEHANIAFTEIGDQAALSEVQINLGYFKLKQQKPDVALAFFNLSKVAAQELNNRSLLARSILGQGHVAFQKKKYDLAEKRVKTALEIALQLEEKTQIRDAYELLAEIYNSQKKFEQSLDAYKQFSLAKDTVLNDSFKGKLSLVKQKYEVKQTNEKADFLAREKAFNEDIVTQIKHEKTLLFYSVIVSTIFLLIIIFLYIEIKKQNR